MTLPLAFAIGFSVGSIPGPTIILIIGFWLGASTFMLLVIFVVARGKKILPPRLEPHLHRFSGVLLIGSGIFLAVRVW